MYEPFFHRAGKLSVAWMTVRARNVRLAADRVRQIEQSATKIFRPKTDRAGKFLHQTVRVMARCTSSEVVKSLRATLQHLDENLAIGADRADRAHLADIKRTILLRIAAIDSGQANRQLAETTKWSESPVPRSMAASKASRRREG